MKERPIIMTAGSVRAILEGRKTQTRRVLTGMDAADRFIKMTDEGKALFTDKILDDYFGKPNSHLMLNRCPYGIVGDKLWVRESFQVVEPWGAVDNEWIGDDIMEVDGRLPRERPEALEYWWNLVYKADDPDLCQWWRTGRFMPRWASRITLEITGVRVERLQDITKEDCSPEGIEAGGSPPWLPDTYCIGDRYFLSPIDAYKYLWDSINAKRGYPWSSNPWVWVLSFKRLEPL